MKIEVITSITSGKDKLLLPEFPGKATFTCFSDQPFENKVWQYKPAYNRFKDPRRNSRIHKILIHKYSDADVTIWHDGKLRLLASPELLVEKYLEDYDMAIFRHVTRDCLYDEAIVVAKAHLDDPEVIIEQAKYYEDHEFSKHKGLCEGGFIIRRNNERTRRFNEAWWADYCRFSRRDQLALMPAIESSGINVNFLNEGYIQYPDGTARREGQLIEHHMHLQHEGNLIR